MKRDVLGGGQPCGLAAAPAQGRRPPKAGGGPTKYHQLAFRNSLHGIGIILFCRGFPSGKRDILGSYRLKRKSVPGNGKASQSAPRLSPGGFLCYLLHPEVASYSRQKPPISSPTFSRWPFTLLAVSGGNLQFAGEAPQSAPLFPPGGPPKRAVLIPPLCLHPLHLPESVDKACT
jgi:hypothetical protein